MKEGRFCRATNMNMKLLNIAIHVCMLFVLFFSVTLLADETSSKKKNKDTDWFARALKTRNLDERIRFLSNAIRSGKLNQKNRTGAYIFRGLALARKGKTDLAIADLDLAIKTSPNYPETYIDRGNLYFEQKKYSRALSDFSRAIELSPKNSSAWFNRGNTYKAMDKYKKARADFAQVLKLNPDDRNAVYQLAVTLRLLNEHRDALTYLRKLDPRKLSPRYAIDLYHKKAYSGFYIQSYDQSLEAFRKYLELHFTDLPSLLHFHLCHKQTETKNMPLKTLLKKYAKKDPKFKGVIDMVTDKITPEKCAELYRNIDNEKPKFICDVNYFIGICFLNRGDKKSAARYFKKSVAAGYCNSEQFLGAKFFLKIIPR